MVERDELELLVLGFGLIERFFQVIGRVLIVLQAPLSRIQEPFLFVKRHVVIQHHVAARCP